MIGSKIEFIKMPVIAYKDKKNEIDIVRVANFLKGSLFVCLEYASAMAVKEDKEGNKQTQGVASMFNYGKGYGMILSHLRLSFPENHCIVHPKTWKGYYGLGKDKKKGIAMAQRMTKQDFILKRCSTPHEGIAESYLIARYAFFMKM